MRYSIMGFNQAKLIELQTDEYKIDMQDILLMDYIQKALSQPSMEKETDVNNQPYVWLKHSKILEDLPILNIKENMLKKRISKLDKLGLIKCVQICENNGRGSKSYYTITELFESLQYDNEMTGGKKLPLENESGVKNYTRSSGPGVKNYTPNSKLVENDNKLKNDNKYNSQKPLFTVAKDLPQKVVDEYNSICTNLPKVRSITDKRKKSISTIVKKYGMATIDEVFTKANENDFLTGNNNRGWRADIDFILREDKFVKILEDGYGSKKKTVERVELNKEKYTMEERGTVTNGKYERI